jgi:ascorbate-specific PTS system EIIC-type component UlaA
MTLGMPRGMVNDTVEQLQMDEQLHVFEHSQNHVFHCLFMTIIYCSNVIVSMIAYFKSHNIFIQ